MKTERPLSSEEVHNRFRALKLWMMLFASVLISVFAAVCTYIQMPLPAPLWFCIAVLVLLAWVGTLFALWS